MLGTVSFLPLSGIPSIQTGDDVAQLLLRSCEQQKLEHKDILVVTQKIISKAEGRMRYLSDVQVTSEAKSLAAVTDKDPRLVALILLESTQVIRAAPGVLIVRHKSGLVCANAGIDQSNIDHANTAEESVLLLPEDANAAAKKIALDVFKEKGCEVAVIISDSLNRPWRLGSIGTAIGAYGMPALEEYNGNADLYGRVLQATLVNRIDALAAMACLTMGEGREGCPAVLVRGFDYSKSENRLFGDTAKDVLRPEKQDLFSS